MVTDSPKSKKSYEVSGILFVGCLFLGIGIGMATDNTGAGTIIGLGGGFILSAIVRFVTGK